jgi:hypothetical protein
MLPEGGTGIEIGVGTGRFAAPLGIKVGVEPARAMGEIARRERGIEVVAGVLEWQRLFPLGTVSLTVHCWLQPSVSWTTYLGPAERPIEC